MKSINRIHKAYKEGTEDWNAIYNMLLDDGVTCEDCKHSKRCCSIFGSKLTDTMCQFHPNRFITLERSK